MSRADVTIGFRAAPVGIYEAAIDHPAIGVGIDDHPEFGRCVGILVTVGDGHATGALLTAAEAEKCGNRILRLAAEAQAEGRA